MTVRIEKSTAEGKIHAPTSKSMAHRLLICAAMCHRQVSVIEGITPCQDVLATIDCLRSLGAKIEYGNARAVIEGVDLRYAKPSGLLNCRESGSTLRFLIPQAWLSGETLTLTGSEKLISRPQSVYEDIAKEFGLTFIKGEDSITVRGPLKCGEYRLRGDVSSQFITGLMLALSLLPGDSRIIITTPLESRSYVQLTIAAMAEFGVTVEWCDGSALLIKGGQSYRARSLAVEGDYSGAAFTEAFNYIGGRVQTLGLNEYSLQGDRVFREHFAALDRGYTEINIEDCPDLGPILFTLAAAEQGARFVGTKRLKIKESDRASVMKEELSKFGAELIIEENAVTVKKRELHTPKSRLCGHNDHRVVMSLAVLCSIYGGEIEGAQAISKSYPDFFKDIKMLGIKAYEI